MARSRGGRRALFGGCALLVAVFIATPAAAASPALSITPSVGPPTVQVTADGTGFRPRELVEIEFDGAVVGSSTTGGLGGFTIPFQVPASALPGRHEVTAVGEDGDSARATFIVRATWPKLHFDAANTGFNPYENVINPGNVAQLTPAWIDPLAEYLSKSPAVARGIVYVTEEDFGDLFALTAYAGKLLWRDGPTDIGVSSPTAAGGLIYYMSPGQEIRAVEAGTGRLVWSRPGLAEAISVVGSVAYSVCSDAHGIWGFCALDAKTGALMWSFQSAPVDENWAIADGIAYVGSSAGGYGPLYALDAATGHPLWSFRHSGADPVIATGVVYVAAPRHVYALKASTGKVLWKSGTGGNGAAIADGVLYVSLTSGGFSALDARSGTRLWKFSSSHAAQSAPSVANGVLYAGLGYRVVALNASTGRELWSYKTGDYVQDSPAVANGFVYAGSNDGSLYAFHLP